MHPIHVVAPLALAALLAECATQPSATQPDDVADFKERNDRFEPANRKFYAVNNALDHTLLRPVAMGYRAAVPSEVRTHLHQTLSNLSNPAQFANDVLQGRPRKAGNTFMRFLINSSIGMGGVFDVAAGMGFPDHDNDFGLTMAVWGLSSGPFLFLPVLGPTDVRDAIGYGANSLVDPLTWASFGGSATLGTTRFLSGAVDGRERVLNDTDSISKTALDPYATYRSLYRQHRESDVAAAGSDLAATVPSWLSSVPVPQATLQKRPLPTAPAPDVTGPGTTSSAPGP